MKFDKESREKDRLLECINLALSNKLLELECVIGNSNMNSRNTRIDFVNVIKRIKGKSPFLKETVKDSLIIQIPQNLEYSRDISRIVLNGGIINQYCSNENLIPILNHVHFEKKVRVEGGKQVKLPAYDIRFNLKEEQDIPKDHKTIQTLVKNWMDIEKSFRRKKTYSFYHNDGDFRIDLSLVSLVETKEKVSYVIENHLQHFVVKPPGVALSFSKWWDTISTNKNAIVSLINHNRYYKDLKASRIMEARDYTYEIEVEWLGNKKDNNIKFEKQTDRNEWIETVFKKFDFCVEIILQAIQGTFFILGIDEKRDILLQMNSLLGTEPDRFFPLAVDLKQENITRLPLEVYKSGNAGINVRMDYLITEKADGARVLLFIDKKGHCYLITRGDQNNRGNNKILDVGLIIPDFSNSVFDGEFITRTHNAEFCQNLYLFDAYFIKGENITKLPFGFGKDQKSLERHIHLVRLVSNFNTASNVLIQDSKYSIRIFKKEYYVGDLSRNKNSNKDTTIFTECMHILQKVNVKYGGFLEGTAHLYSYAIDGIIFQPLMLGVGQNYPGQKVDNIGKRWEANLKWKPNIHTTIDFKIKYNKEAGTNKPIFVYSNDNRYIEAVAFIKLYLKGVGKYVDEMKRYMALRFLNEGEQPEYYPEDYPFNPIYPNDCIRNANGTINNMAEIIHLHVDKTGTVKTEEGDIIEDGMIVECRYDINNDRGFRWLPVRVRSDKTAPNAANTAFTTWNLINNPITLKMITTDGMSDEDKTNEIGFFYYKNTNATSSTSEKESKPIKQFNNFVKDNILERSLSHKNKARVLDLGCGKLGDLHRYSRLGVDTLIGIDVAPDNLINIDDGAAVRILQLKLDGRPKNMATSQLAKKTILILGNLNKNLMDGSAAMDTLNKYYLDIIYGRQKPEGRGKLDTMYGVGINQFHVAISSFAIHYFMSNETDCHEFLLNVQQNVKDQGYFVVFCLDGREIMKALGSKKKIEGRYSTNTEISKVVWSIETSSETPSPNLDKSPYSQSIISYIDTFYKPMVENLVDVKFLETKCLDYDLKLIDSKLFIDDVDSLYEEYQHFNNEIWKSLESKTYLKEWISFHRWMIFQKVDNLNS